MCLLCIVDFIKFKQKKNYPSWKLHLLNSRLYITYPYIHGIPIQNAYLIINEIN